MGRRLRLFIALAITVAAGFAVLFIFVVYRVLHVRSTWADGKRLYEAGRYAEASIPLREFSAQMPSDADGHYWLANALGFSNQVEEAVIELRTAARLDPKNAGYQVALGNALQFLGREVEAEQAFRKSLSLGSKEADVHVSLGYALCKQDRRAEGEQRIAAKHLPRSAPPYEESFTAATARMPKSG